jgi:hypothetical protein
MQLRRIVTEFPKIDPTSYAFTYADTATFEEEVDEWFSYNDAEFRRLHRAKDTFERRWKKFAGKEWAEADLAERGKFLKQESKGLLATDLRRRCKSLQTILHVMLGVWHENAGKVEEAVESKGKEKEVEEEKDGTPSECVAPKPRTKATKCQLDHMKSGILLVAEADGIRHLFQVMQDAFNRLWWDLPLNSQKVTYVARDDEFRETQLLEEDIPFIQDELDNVTTIMYLLIEGIRNDVEYLKSAQTKMRKIFSSVPWLC